MDTYISVKKVQSNGVQFEHEGKWCVELYYPDGYVSCVPADIFAANYFNIEEDGVIKRIYKKVRELLKAGRGVAKENIA